MKTFNTPFQKVWPRLLLSASFSSCSPLTFSNSPPIDFSKYPTAFVRVQGSNIPSWTEPYLAAALEKESGFERVSTIFLDSDVWVDVVLKKSERKSADSEETIFDCDADLRLHIPGKKVLYENSYVESSEMEDECVEDTLNDIVGDLLPDFRL